MSSTEKPIASNTALSETTKKKYTFVVGIDFGTTFSAVAYSRVGELDGQNNRPVITEITKWPMRGNRITTQVPTVSVYDQSGKCIKWGHQTALNGRRPIPGQTTIAMFKLHLDDSRSVNISPLPSSVTVLQAISDYLSELYKYSLGTMIRTLGNIEESSLRFCLTVPAVWTEQAKITMREAAIQAGIINESDPQDRLLLVGEPEAAALYCETFLDQYNLQVNDTFLICDAGGGTVDLVLYRVSIEEDNTRSLIEEVAGNGGMCGSVTLDIKFKEFVEKIFKQLEGTVKPLTDDDLDLIVKTFAEQTKISFPEEEADSLLEDDIILIPLPPRYFDAPEVTLSDRIKLVDTSLQVSYNEIKEKVFEPVINQILDLVESQVEQVLNLNAIFLVGGFGSSPILYSRIKAKFHPQVPLVCSPGRAEMAIVRGAVLMGINPRYVKRRVVRRTYGYECALAFERNLDPDRLRTTSPEGELYCNKRFMTYAIKGEIKDIDSYAETKFHSYYNGSPKLNLFAFDGETDRIPRHTTDRNIKKIAEFQIDLPSLPDKRPEDLLEFKVRFYLYQTEIKVQIEVEGHVKVYTGSYNRKPVPIVGNMNGSMSDLISDLTIGNNQRTIYGQQRIDTSYAQNDSPVNEPENKEELGVQGEILE